MARVSTLLDRDLAMLGGHLRSWRKITGLTASAVAERAGISLPTLRSIERGEPGVRLGNVIMVMRVLGISEHVVGAADPFTTEVGRARAELALRSRVRSTP